MHDPLTHLHAHHGDFAAFRDTMINTSASRFGPIWWGVWQQLVTPPPAPTIVDLGTGPGLLLRGLRERHPDATLIGVDVQPAMLEAAAPLAAEISARLVVADLAGPLPLPDGIADVTTCVHVLHELPDPTV